MAGGQVLLDGRDPVALREEIRARALRQFGLETAPGTPLVSPAAGPRTR
jgi:hypothetical protein